MIRLCEEVAEPCSINMKRGNEFPNHGFYAKAKENNRTVKACEPF